MKKTGLMILLALFLCIAAVLFSSCDKTQGDDETTSSDISAETGDDTSYEEDTTAADETSLTEDTSVVFTSRERILSWAGKEDKEEEMLTKRVDLIPEDISSFDGLTSRDLSANNWSAPYGGILAVSDHNGDPCLEFTGISQEWVSPAFNFNPYIEKAGTYTFSLRYMFKGSIAAGKAPFNIAVRGTRDNDFMKNQAGNVFVNVVNCPNNCKPEEWYETKFTLTVSESDLANPDTWNICFHLIASGVSAICVDDMKVYSVETGDAKPFFPTSAQTWVANEMVLNSSVTREKPIYEAELDLVLKCQEWGITLTVPGFWDGGNTWRVRFALPCAGDWTWETVCSDKTDTGLGGLSGNITCTQYDGDLEIYKRGFLKVDSEARCFDYADGTHFLYLGDTHWTLPTEEYDAPGDNAGKTGAESHFKYIVDKRVGQGFTVYQSEPIGAGFNVVNGITEADVTYFKQLDKYFSYIAGRGLVHANAEFFYPSDMVEWCRHEGFDSELEAATRYWVARYSAYPVLWTLGQEVDKDFYGQLDKNNNPYVKVCKLISELDPYGHPITAHQESTAYTKASDSSFKNAEGHSWFAVQWSPALNDTVDFSTPKDFWNKGGNKPLILYESLYDHLWTNNFGARAEGWLAFLNGMYGYGYGAEDIWYYKSSYDMANDTTQHGITVTVKDKQVPWSQSVEFESAYQAGYMLDFFSNLEWWKLTPRFNDKDYFKPGKNCLYSIASDENNTYVLYLYGSDKESVGTVCGMDDGSDYLMIWFDPITGKYSGQTYVRSLGGKYEITSKPDGNDWVLLLTKTK